MEFPNIPKRLYSAWRHHLKSGDILLCSGDYTFSKLIQKATGSCWSHVAFIMRLDFIDRIMVLESIEGKGVRTIPLSEYVNNFEGTGVGYKGRLALARHDTIERNLIGIDSLKTMAQFAVDRFGYPYDEEEIARITTRIVGTALGFKPDELIRNNEYICSEYVYECYQRLGIDIKHDKRGFVAPVDFAEDLNMFFLTELEVKQ